MRYFLLLFTISFFLFYRAQASEYLDENQPFVDSLHGFSIQPKPHWSVKVMGNSIVLSKSQKAFILIRGVNHKGNLKHVAKSWLLEKKVLDPKGGRYAFKQTDQGIIIVGYGLGFPHYLSPMASVNSGLMGIPLPEDFREITLILPGRFTALVVSLIYWSGLDEGTRREMVDILKTLKLLPSDRMVSWREEKAMDPETGLEAFRMHVPKGFSFSGGVIRMGTSRMPIYRISGDNMSFGIKHIRLSTEAIQSPYGINSRTILNINGAVSQQPQPICITEPEDAVSFLASIMSSATGREWRVVEIKHVPLDEFTKAYYSRMEKETRERFMAMGAIANVRNFKLSYVIKSGELVEVGGVEGNIFTTHSPHSVAPTQNCHLGMMINYASFPEKAKEKAKGLFGGIQSSVILNPQFALASWERFVRENKELNRMVMDIVKRHREDNTRMATAWSNLLSDQTYVKDPQTKEIYRLHKHSWETGSFWREPIFGDVILGGVKEGSKLEELLRTEGWRPLKESLEGFPEMWK